MGSTHSYEPCPKCGYQFASHTLYYNIQQQSIFCERCGYSLLEDGQKCEESHGIGAFSLGFEGTVISNGSLAEGGIEELLKDFEEGKIVDKNGQPPTVLTYTFRENGEWYSKDLISDEVKLFPINLFSGKEDTDEVVE